MGAKVLKFVDNKAKRSNSPLIADLLLHKQKAAWEKLDKHCIEACNKNNMEHKKRVKKIQQEQSNQILFNLILMMLVLGIITAVICMTQTPSKASAGTTDKITFYNYDIEEKNIDYITKDNKILINVDNIHNRIAGIKVKKTWKYISMSVGKKYIMAVKKYSTMVSYQNDPVYMDFPPINIKGKWYIQLDKICEGLNIKYVQYKNFVYIGEGGY
jgi:hypothetical protein